MEWVEVWEVAWACDLTFTIGLSGYHIITSTGVPIGTLTRNSAGSYNWVPDYFQIELSSKLLREITTKLDELNGFGCTDTEEYKMR